MKRLGFIALATACLCAGAFNDVDQYEYESSMQTGCTVKCSVLHVPGTFALRYDWVEITGNCSDHEMCNAGGICFSSNVGETRDGICVPKKEIEYPDNY